MAKVDPSDIQFAEVHDAFTPFEIIGTEDLGFFSPGEGWRAVEEGATQLRGRLPINPSGGLKARGHPAEPRALHNLLKLSGNSGATQDQKDRLKMRKSDLLKASVGWAVIILSRFSNAVIEKES
jgi:acetyl-CoA C-acetyltransferase